MNEEKRALVNQVIGQLQTVIDPELLVNVVDLGLIYGVDIDDEGNCLATMTLTTAGCPLNDYLNREIRQAVGQLAAIKQVDIKLVWYPVWTPGRASRRKSSWASRKSRLRRLRRSTSTSRSRLSLTSIRNLPKIWPRSASTGSRFRACWTRWAG